MAEMKQTNRIKLFILSVMVGEESTLLLSSLGWNSLWSESFTSHGFSLTVCSQPSHPIPCGSCQSTWALPMKVLSKY